MCKIVMDSTLCCGCSACFDVCPKSAITMKEDIEGFLYPMIDHSRCVNCGLCEKVCPTRNQEKSQSLMETYAVYNTDEEIRMKSSSGGLFTLLAEQVLKENGVVYGASFDSNFEVEHIRVTSFAELELLRGSKYVQSKLNGIYNLCKQDLEMGKKVLFTGTPCQIAALKTFLRKSFDNLICMDIICHGVPSRMVWRRYLEYRVMLAKSKIKQIAFRVKDKGWKQFGIKFTFENSIPYYQEFQDDVYMKGFLRDLYLRPSCYDCKFKTKQRVSDITVADFWGINKLHPEWDDDKGMSLLLIHSTKGKIIIDSIFDRLFIKSVDFNMAISHNAAMVKSAAINKNRTIFFEKCRLQGNIVELIEQYSGIKRSLRKRISIWLRTKIKSLFR